MTSSGRRKTHGLATEKSTGRGTAPSVAKNMGYRRKKHHQRRKHTLPMQKTWPAVAKNMPSHQDRRKKHPPPLQKTPPTGTVAKNTKTSQRRKKHELPTQKTRNPYSSCTDIWSFEKSDPPNAENEMESLLGTLSMTQSWKHGAKTELHECQRVHYYCYAVSGCISQMQHIVFRLENPRMYPAHHLKLSLSGPHRCTTSSAAWLWSRFLNGSYRAYPEVLIIHLPSWHSLCPSQSWDLKALFHLKQATTTWINSLPLNSTGQMRRFWVSWHVVLSFCFSGNAGRET